MAQARRPAPTLEAQERRFALVLLAPALAALLLSTTAPLVYLVWNSLHRIDLGMPWLSGFAGLDNYAKMGGDPRFWGSLWRFASFSIATYFGSNHPVPFSPPSVEKSARKVNGSM